MGKKKKKPVGIILFSSKIPVWFQIVAWLGLLAFILWGLFRH